LPAAEGVCGGDGLEAADVFPLLVDLVDKSLVVAEPEDAEPRYRLLETLRQYGGERLREAGEEAAVRTRHLEWFAGLADGAELGLRGPDQMMWLARLDREHDNVRAALAWSQTEPGNAEAGLRLAAGMWQFWYMRTYHAEARRWTQPALSIPGGESIPARGKVLWCTGALAIADGQYDTAEARLRESLAYHQALGTRRGEAEAVIGLGFLAFSQGHHEQAVTLLTEGLAQLRDVGYPFDVAITLGALGLVAQAQDDYARAADLYEQQLALFQAQRDQHGAAWSSQYLGLVAQAQGDHERAGGLYRQALALRRTLGDAGGIAGSLEGLAEVARAQDQPERAARLFGVAAALRETIGYALFPNERVDQERTLAGLRARLGEEAIAAALAEGRAMRLEEAIDYGLAPAGTPAVASAAPAARPKEPATANLSMLLSRREREVALLVARGLTNRQIAEELVISEWTADSHVRHILAKLGVRSRAQVAAWATEQGLVSPAAP
jgi:non-specific serine/threonine protein kinase